jgi:hypoxanthine phosphoribosyltransferase
VLVAPLKSSTVFLADLSRAIPILHTIDMIELAGYTDGRRGGVRLLKDLDTPIGGRHVILVADVVDTGLTLGYLTRTFAERDPASIAAVTLLDRPYRRLVENIGLRHVGFTVPDELFAGYGLGLEERWRALPDLRYIPAEALPAAATDAA